MAEADAHPGEHRNKPAVEGEGPRQDPWANWPPDGAGGPPRGVGDRAASDTLELLEGRDPQAGAGAQGGLRPAVVNWAELMFAAAGLSIEGEGRPW